jgi:ABC-2 type transport system permease protein
MRKIWLVIKREYLTRVRTKGFIFTTIALPLFGVGILLVTILLATRRTDHTLRIAILDNAGGLASPIQEGLKEKLPKGQPLFQVVSTVVQPASEQTVRDAWGGRIRQGQLDGYLVVPKDVTEGKPAEFHTKNPGDMLLTGTLSHAVDDAVIARRLHDRGIKVENLSEVVRGVGLTLVKVTSRGESEEKGQTILIGLSIIMVLYITLAVYGLATMRSVVEEKTTRVVELLVSSLRPFHLLTGKILGVAAVGFTQYLIWTVSGGLLSTYGATMAAAFNPGASLPSIHLPMSVLAYAVIFFVAGFILYASLYAAAGAMVSSDEEAQQVQLPITLFIVVALILYPAIMRDPNSRLAIIVSLIPFFSPILMVFRISLQTPPFWQIALSLGIIALTTLGIVQFSAKIYRVGILMYGKRPSVVELLRWLRYT